MMTADIYHGLPGDNGLDLRWFYGMNDFQQQETLRQAEYKRKNFPGLPDGVWSSRPTYHYPHILPEGHLEKNFYPPIYHPIVSYLEEGDIAGHTELLNLKSSQACCFNFLFHLRLTPDVAPNFLAAALPGVRQVSAIEFEYTGPDGTTEWLGEPPGGRRGQNRTSMDAAIWWQDEKGKKRLTLIEWKYTEAEFGDCGGYKSHGNRQRSSCNNLVPSELQPEVDCYLATGLTKLTSRRYWEHLSMAGISPQSFSDEPGCPFKGPFYQLLRQFLIRAYCQEAMDDVDLVDNVVIGFRDNVHLLQTPSHLRRPSDTIIDTWNCLLTTAPPLRWVSVDELVTGIGNGSQDWRKYLGDRYGV